jgi:hypothetical protein
VGKSLGEQKTPGADAARNKAATFGEDQTLEGLRKAAEGGASGGTEATCRLAG